MDIRLISAALVLAAIPAMAPAAMQVQPAPQGDGETWRPAATPKGGVSWQLLESTKVVDRTEKGIIYSKPQFAPSVKALSGKEIRVAGWMMPLESGAHQKHFVLLAYPPGCPFHMHAMPNQFIEVRASTAVPVNDMRAITLIGTLRLTGEDESGIFYRLENARAG